MKNQSLFFNIQMQYFPDKLKIVANAALKAGVHLDAEG